MSWLPSLGSKASAPVLNINTTNASLRVHAKSSTRRLVLPFESNGGASVVVTKLNNFIALTNLVLRLTKMIWQKYLWILFATIANRVP